MKKTNKKTINSRLTGKLKYLLTNDLLFHIMMQENIEALKQLVCAMMGIPVSIVVSLTIMNPIIYGDRIEDKDCTLDLRLLLNGNRYINLEMQVTKQGYWKQRSITYLCKNYDNLNSGENYDMVCPAMQLSILDFDLFDGIEELCSRYYLINENPAYYNKYSEDFGIISLNLRQINNPKVVESEGNTELYQWARFFKAKTWEELRMLAKENKEIDNCVYSVAKLTEDDKFRMQCEARRDRIAKENALYSRGHREGLEEGIEKGIEKGIE